jgi:hypothetical protein
MKRLTIGALILAKEALAQKCDGNFTFKSVRGGGEGI